MEKKISEQRMITVAVPEWLIWPRTVRSANWIPDSLHWEMAFCLIRSSETHFGNFSLKSRIATDFFLQKIKRKKKEKKEKEKEIHTLLPPQINAL